MIFDVHMHTEHSSDSQMKIEDVIEKSKELNIGITVTEHLDLDYPDKFNFRVDIPKYLKAYMPLRSEELLLGIEMGMANSTIDENKKIYETYENQLDYILGSIHSVDGTDIYTSLTTKENIISKKAFYEAYLENMVNCINQYYFIDSLAHIDYICRYGTLDDPEIYYHEFSSHIDEVFKALIKNNTVIEINTARLQTPSAFENMLKLYTRYKELGGKFVTIGSDAHNTTQIARNLNEAKIILEKTGLKPVHFKERKMIIDLY